ncbi:virulence factor TspB C-terminal domain-related protein [Comamonas thiooxydans]|uniref:virulence factor TspB C-terminal domain-related protein n=1 Tax=Comamonas thiooxydans TaxID=363952 RepID=UPI0013D8E8D3|nr:virulence factor TspB C-terminal domain-related protein [Comamonas thiooxydans]
MDHRAALIFAASLLCGSVHAGYAQLAAPEGWSGGGGAAATYRYPSAANAASYSGGAVRANAILNVGGKAVTVPAAMRMASNAGRIAAAAIYLHPGLRTIAAVATWLGVAGLVYDVADGLWKRVDPSYQASDGFIYYVSSYSPANSYSSAAAACQGFVAKNFVGGGFADVSISANGMRCSGTYTRDGIKNQWFDQPINKSANPSCPAGWYVSPAGCVSTPPMKPVSQPEFEQMVPDARPMPPELPGVVWPASWPVEVPEIQPMFVPTGAPVKNPSYDPSKPTSPDNQPYVQPGVKVTPAPGTNAPWQVNLQPVNRPVEGPTASPDPVVDPVPNPGPNPGTDSTDTPRDPEKDDRDFCDKHPDVLACQKMDEPEDPGNLKTKAVDLDFQVQSGYAGSAVCPAPMTYEAFGHVLSLSWQPFCDSLAMVKNLLLAFAWISAAFILLGAKKE